MYRHGDLLITVATIPAEANPTEGQILAWGEVTGHHHKIEPLRLKGRYLVSECRPGGGYDAQRITGAQLLKRQNMDFQGGRKAPSLFERNGEIFFRCHNTTVLTHQEHGSIVLPPGDYHNRIQREYRRGEVPRQVVD